MKIFLVDHSEFEERIIGKRCLFCGEKSLWEGRLLKFFTTEKSYIDSRFETVIFRTVVRIITGLKASNKINEKTPIGFCKDCLNKMGTGTMSISYCKALYLLRNKDNTNGILK
jgi:hypothetical protein